MEITDSIAVVTGANPAATSPSSCSSAAPPRSTRPPAIARDPQHIDLPGVVPLQLDITVIADEVTETVKQQLSAAPAAV
jgi:hypothetical protein